MRTKHRLRGYLWRQWMMRVTTLLAIMLCISSIAQADDPETHSLNAEAHTHGMAMLRVVMEEDFLLLDIQSPAVNLLGFERQVDTSEQVDALHRTQKLLADTDSSFQFDGGNCELLESIWDFSSVESGKDDHHGHDHGEYVAADYQDQFDQHDQHSDEDQHAHKTEHRDLEGRYRYKCANPAALEAMKVLLFDAFSGVEAVRVEWIVHGHQGAVTLDANNKQVSFR